ncbi:uncharacterized protein MONBRDRAFT_9023 [Monosiga brevicollis MX1]|uniref:CobW C-terminal domain-containing protein n=1 Tax=Monosiga brevicollis TaxID=81824 RepID=A9V1U9_MONBE|nr:uncharacterized protein MONBRDRAFT_9023 [Monosiga brevicollis MX1]EDQ88627.1 predicted protein [Monosiga brevicollis MX1]|eukprot:XP_001746731.1 hypothetical protein [Monosiga brevicollis MX1]
MAQADKTTDRIPVTVLTGFLGSGKTTFINYILKEKHGLRIAVVENEFGEVGIDDGLVLQTDEEVIEMMNGCICCTVRDDLIQALTRLATERRHMFDYVVIETTGLADPAPVAQTFFVDEKISQLYVLDSIVTFVDCQHISSHLEEIKPEGVENEAIEQVAFADVLVLNKTDLVSAAEIKELRKRLAGINATARMLESEQSRIPLDAVLNIRAFDLEKTLQMDAEFLDTDADHLHDKSVSSVGIVIEGECIPNRLNDWLSEILRTKGADIFRSKGILAMMGTDEKFVFQGVHMLLNMGGSGQLGLNLTPWQPGEKRVNKLCFIGRNLDRAELTAGFQACVFNGKFPEPGSPPKQKLRFKVGDPVMAKVGPWAAGVITALWYREPLWETGRFAPYQVRLLEDDGLVWVPRDSDVLIRARDKSATAK